MILVAVVVGHTSAFESSSGYMEIEFKEKEHEYFLGGRQIDSISNILKFAGYNNVPYFSDWYAKKGKYIHTAIEYYLSGILNESSLDPLIKPYLDAYRDWERDFKVEHLDWEKKVYNESPEFCGRYDERYKITREGLVDWKSGQKQKWHEYQVCGYAIANYGKDWLKYECGLLYLRPEAKRLKYRWIPMDIMTQMAAGAEFLRIAYEFEKNKYNLFNGN